MKSLLILFSLVLYAVTSTAVSQTSLPFEYEKLNGKVKSVEETYMPAKSDQAQKSMIWKYQFRFSRKGQVISWARCHSNSPVISSENFEYDRKSKRIFTRSKHNSSEELIHTLSYKYDSIGRMSEVRKSFADTAQKEVVILSISYNHDGLIGSRIFYDDKGEKRITSTSTYDSIGFRIESRSINVNSGSVSRSEDISNAEGLLKDRKTYNERDELVTHFSYLYDEFGNVKSVKSYNADGTLKFEKKTEYDFDRKSNWVKRTITGNGNTTVRTRKIKYFII